MHHKKPYIICHMACTINGKIIPEHWGKQSKTYSKLYQECHESFDSQAWLCGRVTLEKDFTNFHSPVLNSPENPINREPFIGDKNATSFAIAIDSKGVLGWQENEISGDHIIEVLTEAVSDAYLHFLQQQSISYIFAGKKEIDFEQALQQLTSLFPIKTIMLEGGGHMNGAFLQKNLVDELSILILPIADATAHTPSVFEMEKDTDIQVYEQLQLTNVEQLDAGVVWMKYNVQQ